MVSTITDRQRGLVTQLGAKAPVIAGSTGNINVSAVPLYAANGVRFGSTDMYMRREDMFTGATNSSMWSFSVWFYPGSSIGTSAQYFLLSGAGSTGAYVACVLPSQLFIFANRGDGGGVAGLSFTSTAASISASTWNHLMFSVDMGSTLTRHVYFNNSSMSSTLFTVYLSTKLFFESTAYTVHSSLDMAQGEPFTCSIADLWHAPGQYINLDQSSNRGLFITTDLKVVNLGSAGATPTGVSPALFLSGQTTSWATNLGSGGGTFTAVNSSLIDSTSDPRGSTTFTVDTVAVSSGERVLLRGQTSTSQNGIYVLNSSGWTRAPDFDKEGDCTQGTLVFVAQGTTTNKKWWYVSSTGQNIPDGSSNITFASSIHRLQD